MRILLDSKDLIDLVEHDKPISVAEMDRILRAGAHQLVLSFTNVTELVAPLNKGIEFADLRPTLLRTESLPVCYMRGPIVAQELRAAVKAFDSYVTPTTVNPYVSRFDDVVTPRGRTATDVLIGFPLWEIVWVLWKENALRDYRSSGHADALRAKFEFERSLDKDQKPSEPEAFAASIARNLDTYAIARPVRGMETFGKFLYENPNWCPSNRIGFELYLALYRNRTDVPKDGDISDLKHLGAIPYVDAITSDNRMRRYIEDVLRRLSPLDSRLDYGKRVFSNLQEMLNAI
jgi:hypothetical protein